MTDQTTVSLRRDHKPAIDEAQAILADELGFTPTKGETVAYLCRNYVENDG